jgi:hypothetical protein
LKTKGEKEEGMRLNLKALALTAGVVWASALFLTGLANLAWPRYGVAFLELMASVYPGYHAGHTFGQVIVGACYAFVDGAVSGLIFGWLYNLLAGRLR